VLAENGGNIPASRGTHAVHHRRTSGQMKRAHDAAGARKTAPTSSGARLCVSDAILCMLAP